MTTKRNPDGDQRVRTQGEYLPPQIWDSKDYGPTDALTFLREEVCSRGMVWLPSLKSKVDILQARFENREAEKGVISRVWCPFLELERTPSEIAKSTFDGYFAGIILSGSMAISQNDAKRVVKPGDLFLYDLSHPVKLGCEADLQCAGFQLRRGASPTLDRNREFFRHLVVDGDRLSAPLRNCFYFLAERMMSSEQETSAVLEATLNLLPIDAGCFHSEDIALVGDLKVLYREIILFCDRNLKRPNLSPKLVAETFDISERYVFKLFAEHGLRFGGYIRSRRLQGAAAELRSRQRVKITDLAYDWGFSDLSEFSRAFTKKFGCSPREFQSRFS